MSKISPIKASICIELQSQFLSAVLERLEREKDQARLLDVWSASFNNFEIQKLVIFILSL